MDTLSYKTRSINKENADKKWWLVDAEGQTLGRLSTQIATLLRGKHKTNFTPHADCGDYVVVVNAEKVVLTGNKMETKTYMRYTGYPGGQRERTASEQLKRKPFAWWKKPFVACSPRTVSEASSSATCTCTWVPTTSTKPSNQRHTN